MGDFGHDVVMFIMTTVMIIMTTVMFIMTAVMTKIPHKTPARKPQPFPENLV